MGRENELKSLIQQLQIKLDKAEATGGDHEINRLRSEMNRLRRELQNEEAKNSNCTCQL